MASTTPADAAEEGVTLATPAPRGRARYAAAPGTAHTAADASDVHALALTPTG
ncbi:hypothetical protein [Streptomyces sp. CRN 30]|uniref:hypothetical protein n=1 Tax=Streptomyces sp. CRN 30 TaxID=3075613 RepID=UPI002A8011B0|nr:hypothetical protein [Streptomyces sp. CRN 30]